MAISMASIAILAQTKTELPSRFRPWRGGGNRIRTLVVAASKALTLHATIADNRNSMVTRVSLMTGAGFAFVLGPLRERLNKGWGMDEGNGDLLTGDGTG